MYNQFKTFLFMAALTLILVWLGGMVGGKDGMLIALIIAGAMNFFSYWYSDRVVLAMYRAREVTPEEEPTLHRIVDNLSQKAGIKKPKVYVIETDTPNAFATGRGPNHAAVAVTRGIMRLLDEDELTGVLGHELTHIIHRDILISTISATLVGAITFLANIARWSVFFGAGRDDEGPNPIAIIVFSLLAGFAAVLIQLAISRSREYLADEGGAKLSGNPLYLARALEKLEKGVERVPMDVNPSTAHMFIVNPLRGRGSGVLALFSTHPPTEERIKRLLKMAGVSYGF